MEQISRDLFEAYEAQKQTMPELNQVREIWFAPGMASSETSGKKL